MLKSRIDKHQPERIIENQILDWLRTNRIFAWPNKIGFQKGRRKHGHLKRTNGVADILGIFKGKPLAIEVKTPTGRLSVEQEVFLSEFALSGGISIVARSLEDVESILIV